MITLEHFRNKRSSRRMKKLGIVLVLIGIILLPFILIYSYLVYTPISSSDFPIIKINTEGELNYEDYIDCTFELNYEKDSDNIATLDSKIRIRGSGLGWNNMSPKKGYRLELSESKSLLGMRKDDDWLLFSLYLDYPRTRIKLSFELWRSLLPTNPTAIFPNSKYVCLELNGEFQGLYLLAEKNDRTLFNLDNPLNNINSSLIFQAKYESTFGIYDPSAWDQDWPNDYEGFSIMNEVLLNLFNFVKDSDDKEFYNSKENIFTKFQRRNLIDFYVFNYFIDHQDFWNHNYYLIRNTYPEKFYLIPWDFDMSFGQYIWKRYDADVNRESEIRKINILYRRILSNKTFREDCKNRKLILISGT